MEMRVVVMPKITHRVLLSLSCCAVPLFSLPVHAQEFLCDATQAASNQLPVLDKACPIGQGLWGNSAPKRKDSDFWIQCGLLTKPLSLAQAQGLYQHISTHVWMKPEDKGTRCLIGPYDDFAKARKDLRGVRTVTGYKEAFIREVAKSTATSVTAAAPVKRAPAAPQAAPKPAKAQTPASQPKPAVSPKPVVAAEPAQAAALTETRALPATVASQGADVSFRHQASLNGVSYVVPYTLADNVQFYMEHNKAWNRLSYDGAEKMCRSQNMRLATEQEWKQLLNSKVMEREQWPVYLPYWGEGRKGLFTNGRTTNLKGTSLLNVLCVKG